MRLTFSPSDLETALHAKSFSFQLYTGAAGEVDLVDFINQQSASVRERSNSNDVKVQYELACIRQMLARLSKQLSEAYPQYMIVLSTGMNAGSFRLVNRSEYLTINNFKPKQRK